MNRNSVTRRIVSDPELFALYGEQGERDVVLPPGPLETSLRTMQDAPDVVTDEENRKMVEKTEKLIHQGLRKVGVSGDTIKKIQTLRDLNIMGGQIIAQSLSDVYQLYYIDIMNIPQRRKEIKDQFLDNKGCTGMEKMFWQRADAELLEMMGKGLDRFLSGTQAMLAMERGKKKAGQKLERGTPGW